MTVSPNCHQEILDVIAQDKAKRSVKKHTTAQTQRERSHISPSSKNKMASEHPKSITTSDSLWQILENMLIVIGVVSAICFLVFFVEIRTPCKYLKTCFRKSKTIRDKKGRSRLKKHHK